MAADPHNAVRLILPDGYDDAAAAPAAVAGRRRARRPIDEPTFSVYRMTFTGDDGEPVTTTGVIGALGLDARRP